MAVQKVKVLGLDNTNRVAFVTLSAFYRDAAELMERCLLEPHEERYEIRMVTALDLNEEDGALFDLLDECENPFYLFTDNFEQWMKREKAFNHFWVKGSANEFYT